MNRRVLIVDDEPNILASLRRNLEGSFEVDTEPGAPRGLIALKERPQYAVVISDMRMPNMDGIQFLKEVQKLSPQSIRIMLTGALDFQICMKAINEVHVSRFLTKPCSAEAVEKVLEEATEAYNLSQLEKELLSNTLSGTIKVLTEILSTLEPTVFAHNKSARQLVGKICHEMKVKNAWEVELATMLSNLGCATLPPAVLERWGKEAPLSDEEQMLIKQIPQLGYELLKNIPRLEGVADIIRYHQKQFNGGGDPKDGVKEKEIPLGSRILKAARDYCLMNTKTMSEEGTQFFLKNKAGSWYDPQIVELICIIENSASEEPVQEPRRREVHSSDLLEGMRFASDVLTVDGLLLVPKETEATQPLIQRILNYSKAIGLQGPIEVYSYPDE